MSNTVDKNRMIMTVELINDDGDEVEVELPIRFEVCGRCDGKGSHVNPSIDGDGITSEEWNGPDWNDESHEMYMSGGYDVHCEECHGERVAPIVDKQRCDPVVLDQYLSHLSVLADLQRDEEAERRFGC